MDFYAMKRKRLQSLCKKHGIPANLKNKEMADQLSFIFKGKENPESCHLGSDSVGTEKGTFHCASGKDMLNVETLELNPNSGTNNIQMVASDIVAGKDTDGKINVTAEHFLDEVHSSIKCSDGTPDQFLPTYPLSEVKSSDLNIHHMVASGTAVGNADACEVKFVSSQHMSEGPEGWIDFPPKLYENSLIERLESKMNLPSERRDEIGFSYVEENLQTGVNKEQVDDNRELHSAAPSEDVHVASEEFGNYLVEGEVEKLGDKSNVHEDTCETRKVGTEAEEQDHTNSPQGSNINYVNLLHVSPKESSGHLVEGEVHKLDDNICVHGAVYNDRNNISEAATMRLDASIGAKDTDGKTNVTVEQILDEVHSSSFEDSDGISVQFLPTYPLSEVKTSDLDGLKMVCPGPATKNADTCEAKSASSQKKSISPTSEKMIGFSPKLQNNSETQRDDIGLCDMEENNQIGVNKEQVDHSQEVLHAEPNVVVMNVDDIGLCDEENMQICVNKELVDHSQEVLHAEASVVVMNDDEDLVQVASEEFGNNLVEGEGEKWGDKIDPLEGVCGTEKGRDEAEKQGGNNSPQGSNVSEVNLLHVSPGESSLHLAGGQVQKSDDNILRGGVYNLGKSGSGVDAFCFLDTSIAAKDTDGKTNVTTERFPYDVHSSSVKYSDGTPDQLLTTRTLIEVMSSDLNIRQMFASDTCGEMLKSSQKTGLILDPEECIGFSPNNLEASTTKGFEAETYFDPSTLGDVVGTCNMKESMQSDRMEKENNQEEFSLVQGEVTRLFNNSVVHDDTGGIGAEDENQPYMVSRKRKKSDVDNASGPNSDEKEKPDEFVPSMPQPCEMESCNFKLHQIFASDTAYQEKLESPPKGRSIASSEKIMCFSPKLLEPSMMYKEVEIETNMPLKPARDIVGTWDMKENIKIDKKEQVGTIMSKNKFSKRQPLQDLQQN